jgi:hypothetical protein
LLIVGYLGVVGGTVALIDAYSYEGIPENTVSQVALGLAIGLAGLACWRWIVSGRTSGVDPVGVSGPTRWMAAAAFVLAAYPAAQAYQTYDNHQQFVRLSSGRTLLPALPTDPRWRSSIRCWSSHWKYWIWILGTSASHNMQEESPDRGLAEPETVM